MLELILLKNKEILWYYNISINYLLYYVIILVKNKWEYSCVDVFFDLIVKILISKLKVYVCDYYLILKFENF